MCPPEYSSPEMSVLTCIHRIKHVQSLPHEPLLILSLWDLSDSYSIMMACWENNPEDRPSFSALVEILGDLLQTCVQQVGHYIVCVCI